MSNAMTPEMYESLFERRAFTVPRKRAIFSQAVTGLTPADVRRAYNVPDHLNGAGQTIGIMEFGSGYSKADVGAFAKQFLGLDSYDLEFVSIAGAANDDGVSPVDMEATLDIQWALAMAPKAKIIVYEAPAGSDYQQFGEYLLQALQFVLSDVGDPTRGRHPSVLSISYGDAEINFNTVPLYTGVESALASLAEKGVSVFVSSGDQGAYGEHNLRDEPVPNADFPASCPHAIPVGGTALSPDGTETAWTYFGPANGGAGGGGFSFLFEAPVWQAAVLKRYHNSLPSDPSKSGRGIPDVAAVADPASGCQVIFEGRQQAVGGTSLAAPIWAGLIALVNQALGKPAGFFLPALYGQPGACRDITEGNNSYNGVMGYQAAPGWDPCTGLGSPNVAALIALLSGKPLPQAYKVVLTFADGKASYTVNGKTVIMPAGTGVTKDIDGHLMIPVRMLASVLGAASVTWDESTMTATVRTAKEF